MFIYKKFINSDIQTWRQVGQNLKYNLNYIQETLNRNIKIKQIFFPFLKQNNDKVIYFT